MQLRAGTTATFGDLRENPALDNVRVRLRSLRGEAGRGPLRFAPGIQVTLRSHLQVIVRLPTLRRAPTFVLSRSHENAGATPAETAARAGSCCFARVNPG